MLATLVHALAAYGLAHIVTESDLFDVPRRLAALVPGIGSVATCVECATPWASLLLSLLGLVCPTALLPARSAPEVIVLALLSYAATRIITRWADG